MFLSIHKNQTALTFDSITFSSTQTWDSELLSYLPKNINNQEKVERTSYYLKNIELPYPPRNSSIITMDELVDLHKLSNKRTKEIQNAIENELHFKNLTFDSFIVGNTEKEATQKIIYEARNQLNPVITSFKKHFDRVRPSYLDTSLTTTIEVPKHPSYPSGHATESYVYALILSELDPVHEADYIRDALKIAKNREIAGVHYKSDSRAGRELATQFFYIFIEDQYVKKLFELARAEWNLSLQHTIFP